MFTRSLACALAVAVAAPVYAAPTKAPLDVNVVNTPLVVTRDDSVFRVGMRVGWIDRASPANVIDAYGTVTFPVPVVIEQVSGVCANGVLAAFLSFPWLEAFLDADNGVTFAPQVGDGYIDLLAGLFPLPIQTTPVDYANVTKWIAPVPMKLRVSSQIDVRVRKPQLYTGSDVWCNLLIIARPATP